MVLVLHQVDDYWRLSLICAFILFEKVIIDLHNSDLIAVEQNNARMSGDIEEDIAS